PINKDEWELVKNYCSPVFWDYQALAQRNALSAARLINDYFDVIVNFDQYSDSDRLLIRQLFLFLSEKRLNKYVGSNVVYVVYKTIDGYNSKEVFAIDNGLSGLWRKDRKCFARLYR